MSAEEVKVEAKAAEPAAAPVDSKPVESATEPKTESKEAPAAEAKPADKLVEAARVPDKYELKLADGSLLAQSRLDEIAAEAKELGLSNDEAQKFVAREEAAAVRQQEQSISAYREQQIKWKDEIKNDPEFGGDKTPETAEHAKRFVDAFADEDMKKAFESTGFGDYPPAVRMLARAGKAILGEGRLVNPTGAGKGEKKSVAEVLFGGNK